MAGRKGIILNCLRKCLIGRGRLVGDAGRLSRRREWGGEERIFVRNVRKRDKIEVKEEKMEDDKDIELLESEREENVDADEEKGDCGD